MKFTKSKKMLASMLVTALLTSTGIATHSTPVSAHSFSDVPDSHWAYATINDVTDHGLMVGMGGNLFSPDTDITIPQLVQSLYQMTYTHPHEGESENYPAIVGRWYEKSAAWALNNGLTDGVTSGYDNGGRSCTRAEAATILYNFIVFYDDSLLQNDEDSTRDFNDIWSLDDWTQSRIEQLSAMGIICGRTDHSYVPNMTLTRAEAAALVSRLYSYVNDSEKTTSDYIDAMIEAYPEDDFSREDLSSYTLLELQDLVDTTAKRYRQELIETYEWTQEDAENLDVWEVYNTYQEVCQRKEFLNAFLTGNLHATSQEMDMINRVNQLRLENGLSTLSPSPALMEAADIRAQEATYKAECGMEVNAKVIHTRLDGSRVSTVLKEIDAFEDFQEQAQTATLGENISYLIRKKSKKDYSAEAAYTSFYESSTHFDNMLKSHYRYIGVAKYTTNDTIMWIQIFY